MQHAKKALFLSIFVGFSSAMLLNSQNNQKMRNFIKILICFFLFSMTVSCGKGFFKKVDTREVPISGPERAKKNIREGRGVGLGQMVGRGKGSTN